MNELKEKINKLTEKIIFKLSNNENIDDLKRNINIEILILIVEDLQKILEENNDSKSL